MLASGRNFVLADCAELDFEIDAQRGAAALPPGTYYLRVQGQASREPPPLPYLLTFWLLSQRVARVDGSVYLPDSGATLDAGFMSDAGP